MNVHVFALSFILALVPVKNSPCFGEEECLVFTAAMTDSTTASGEGGVVDYTFGTFSNAVSMSAASDGNLFILDEGNNQLLEYAPNGSLLKSIGGRGWGDLEFDSPTDVSVNFALDVYVTDYNNRRVQRFDRRMNLVQSINADNILPSLNGMFYPRATALSPQGELFVVESDGRRILKFNPAQELEREFGEFNAGAGTLVNPRDIAVTPEDKVIVLDEHRIVEFDTYGNYLYAFRLDSLAVPLSISLVPNGVLVVDTNRVILYSLDGVKKLEIDRKLIIGEEPIEEFRDAVATGSKLFILTLHTLVVVEVNPR
ncbi:MAG: NHL repeat-containing protein [Bacteroidota bacterium]